MHPITMSWSFLITLLASLCLHAEYAVASPSINVELKAAFPSPPYLIELLETAGDENATSYFPLLDRIADGYFSSAATDEDLYNLFTKLLKDDGHMDAQTLSSYRLALSLHSTAPRVEAHYQFYHTAVEPSSESKSEASCPNWVYFHGHKYCTPSLVTADSEVSDHLDDSVLRFDRVLGNLSAPASILYADITSPTFGQFHKTLVQTALEGKTSYRIRHRKSLQSDSKQLLVSGYGVELALKRTDYIVIDDRDEDTSVANTIPLKAEINLEDEEIADLKPLSTSELFSLGLKAASFIMQSEDSFQTLIKISQDFPKYSTAIAAHNASENFLTEHIYNRGIIVPAGMNVFWVNGLQMIERQVDALALLDLLRRERALIDSVTRLGLSAPAAIQLLSHPEIGNVLALDEPERYDWRDHVEGSDVIIWLNDIEKDKRYADWSEKLTALLQRVFPGQLPGVRKDIFNVIIPVDLSSVEDLQLVTEQIQAFIKRKIPIRFGLVPLITSSKSLGHGKVAYYLRDTYGVSALMAYLESMSATGRPTSPQKSILESITNGRNRKREKVVRSLDQVLIADDIERRIDASQQWIYRLAADGKVPTLFVNGVAIPRSESWLQGMSSRINLDLQSVQRAVFEETLVHEWVPMFFIDGASNRRNPLIVPEDEGSLKVFDVNRLYEEFEDTFDLLPVVPASTGSKEEWSHMILITNLNTDHGQQLLTTALAFQQSNPGLELVVLHNPESLSDLHGFFSSLKGIPFRSLATAEALNEALNNFSTETSKETEESVIQEDEGNYWAAVTALLDVVGLALGQQGLLINGRLIGPIPAERSLIFDDFVELLAYERKSRITPVFKALDALGLIEKINSPLSGAKITSLVALSSISDLPEGLFEQESTLRMNSFDSWQSENTAIKVGDPSSATIRITAAVDPTSEQAQKWIPILKVLSELDGIYLELFLNPKERLQELPVKRFYRYILNSAPIFDENGNLRSVGARFTGVPKEALLTVGMDVPPAWLVAPKESVHDLDNVKLSSVKGDVDALYELENILIEGHSRETPSGDAPRGAQLVLTTPTDPHFADTIIMANLGYFQFKANPGYYNINLKKGRSSDIFKIDSLGSLGFNPIAGDENTEVALMSFQGTTLYPRLSRNRGYETEDVLEARTNLTRDFVKQGLKFAEGILGWGKGNDEVAAKEADINIFSVASGHLYERMLDIMMVSVMKHTKHTVKFWFIEQFLSPSFKEFIPYLAAEYGFQYEMVTYKWPHWLRAQKEKQREIWGYKILFLDVLFPLSLDKVIFVDADQIVRTDMIELVNLDLKGAPYGFTPMCDSRTEMEGFRFWKQGYWKGFLKGLPYHISALYVVDLRRFRQIAAGDRLRQQYHQLSADPQSLSNLDQDLPNHMQMMIPIHSLPQEWLWCETWCSDESLKDAKTIDLCNNPLTKEPKLDRARRQVPEWTMYDDEIAAVDRRRKGLETEEKNSESGTMEAEPTASHKIDEL